MLVPPTEFFKAKTAITELQPDVEFEMEEITYLPQTAHPMSAEDAEQFERFAGLLNDLDDVQEIYHNAEFSD